MSGLCKFVAVARLGRDTDGEFKADKHCIISFAAANKGDPNLKAYKKQVGAIMVKGASRISAGKRIRLTSEDNQSDLYVTAYYSEDDLLAFFVIVDPKFGSHLSISNVFDDFKEGFFSRVDARTINKAKTNGSAQKKSANFLDSLLTKFSSGKLGQVQQQVDDIRGVMEDNIKITLQNVESMEEMEEKVENLHQASKDFSKQSGNLAHRYKCQHYKTTFMIIAFVVIVLTIIIAIIVSTQDDS